MTRRHLLSPKCWQEWGAGDMEARAGNTKGPALKQWTVFLEWPSGSEQGSGLTGCVPGETERSRWRLGGGCPYTL